jgi:DNA-binding NarL/FixJ family response regulator
VRVLLVDDEALIRTGLRMILEVEPDVEVAGEAGDGLEAVDMARRSRPDVVLMDIRMPRLDGLEATRRILSSPGLATRVVVLTTFEDDEYIFSALRAGASGFLLKTAPAEQLVDALRAAAAGDAALAPSVARRLIVEFTSRPAPVRAPPSPFTERETAVLALVAQGLSNSEIAARLFVGEATVKSHVGSMLGKLGLRDRVQLVVHAYETGLVRPGAAG